MEVKNLLTELDETILFADILGAAQRFFDEDVVIKHSRNRFSGKDEKISTLSYFLNDIQQINQIKLHGNKTSGSESKSLFTFDFTMKNGDNLVWYEVIRRKWKDGKVVEEEYFTNPSSQEVGDILGEPVKKRGRGRPKGSTNRTPAEIASTKTKGKRRVGRPRKRGPKPAGENSELRQIEGIGTKVATLLIKAGIKSLDDLAKAKKEEVQEVLKEAGPRFKDHDPSDWIQKASAMA